MAGVTTPWASTSLHLPGFPGIFEPETAYGYSNAGTCVAGLAAQRVMGRNWEALLAGRILRPLGLEHSANFPEDLLYHPVALGYSATPANPEGLRVPFWGLPRSMAPAGATLCCSAGDLVRFAALFLRDGRSADGRQVLSEQPSRRCTRRRSTCRPGSSPRSGAQGRTGSAGAAR